MRVKVSHFTEEALRTQDEAYLASLPKIKPPPMLQSAEVEKPKVVKHSKEEELLRDKWSRLLEMIGKGRLEALKQFWEREGAAMGGVNAQIPEWMGESRATLLQVASLTGQEQVTAWLLTEAHADPTIPVPMGKGEDSPGDGRGDFGNTGEIHKKSKRTAYDIAKTKAIRDIFRRCADEHPDWWDWLGDAHIPSVLSKDMEDEQNEKKKTRRKGLKDRVREREVKEKEKPQLPEPEPIQVTRGIKPQGPSEPQRLGGSSGSTDAVLGLTSEMRARIERERRARAAEARLKASRA